MLTGLERARMQTAWCVIALLMTLARGAVHPIPLVNRSGLHCSNQFTLHNSHCYRYFGENVKRAYFHAQRQCLRHQSTLVSIHSAQEESFVVALAAEDNSSFWIGLNDHDGPGKGHREGVFKWGTEGGVEGYAHWQTGEPNNKQHLDCVRADTTGWAMAASGCASTKLPFVCKRIACPEGLDVFNGVCDIILTEEVHHWPHPLHSLTVVLALSLALTALLTYTRLRYRSQPSRTVSKDTTAARTHLAVEELLYPT